MVDVYDDKAVTVPDLFETSPHALSNAVRWLTPNGTHWSGGIQYDVYCTNAAVTTMTCVSGSPGVLPSKAATWEHVSRGARAFTVYSEVDCTPDQSFWDEAERDVLLGLTRSGPTQMERTFWSGATSGGPPVFPNLTTRGPIYDTTGMILLQPSSTIISGVPLDFIEGLGRLEQAFAECYDGVGVIHSPTLFAAEFGRRGITERRGNRLFTNADNEVVFGHGYSTTIGPNGVAPPAGSAWIYMTSPIFGIRGPVRTYTKVESFDRNVNTLKMIAEQTILLAWECCLVGVLVTFGGDLAGAPFSNLQAF